MPIKSPYAVLGVPPTATAQELRAAYRRLVRLHHPDHNQGSLESTRRFEEVQEAYAQVLRERKDSPPPHRPATDPELDDRLRDLERQVKAAQERARRAAREAAREAASEATATGSRRPSDEELGYYTTDDTFASILADARTELAEQLAARRHHPVVRHVSDLLKGLEDLASRLDRRPPR
jgi:curved DNA-binding protein CbpA